MREQSRELSRRSILQSAIARAGVITGPVASNGFLDHQHRFGCVSAPGLPIGSTVESDRSAEPWFQAAPRPKSIHSPRMAGDWYGDPIERLQVMGTMHQRGLEKCKDPIRGQSNVANAGECGAAFAGAGYSVDFNDVNRERELRRQENIPEYGEFADGQKWHPYQVSAVSGGIVLFEGFREVTGTLVGCIDNLSGGRNRSRGPISGGRKRGNCPERQN